MLESQTLWLSPDRFLDGSPRAARTVRTVHPQAGGVEIGRIIAEPLRWWPWRVVARYEAFETPDYSALFAARRAGWLPGDWDIIDADGRLVGLLRRGYLLGPDGSVIGSRRPERDRGAGVIVEPNGAAIGRWQPDDGGTRVEFSAAISEQPFSKMTILTAVVLAL